MRKIAAALALAAAGVSAGAEDFSDPLAASVVALARSGPDAPGWSELGTVSFSALSSARQKQVRSAVVYAHAGAFLDTSEALHFDAEENLRQTRESVRKMREAVRAVLSRDFESVPPCGQFKVRPAEGRSPAAFSRAARTAQRLQGAFPGLPEADSFARDFPEKLVSREAERAASRRARAEALSAGPRRAPAPPRPPSQAVLPRLPAGPLSLPLFLPRPVFMGR